MRLTRIIIIIIIGVTIAAFAPAAPAAVALYVLCRTIFHTGIRLYLLIRSKMKTGKAWSVFNLSN